MMYPAKDKPKPVTAVDEFFQFMQPESRRDELSTLQDSLPSDAQADLKPVIRRLDALGCLRLIAIATPQHFREFLLSDDSPSAHRLVLELVESAQTERFIATMLTTFTESEPKSMDDILSCL